MTCNQISSVSHRVLGSIRLIAREQCWVVFVRNFRGLDADDTDKTSFTTLLFASPLFLLSQGDRLSSKEEEDLFARQSPFVSIHFILRIRDLPQALNPPRWRPDPILSDF